MWIAFSLAPRPDVAYWPGRRALAALDAVVWPVLLLFALDRFAPPVGVTGSAIAGFLVYSAVGRVWRALFANHRYRFTATRLLRFVATLALIGLIASFRS